MEVNTMQNLTILLIVYIKLGFTVAAQSGIKPTY
jgi:hypothetical protein